MPSMIAGACRCCEVLANPVGTIEPAEISGPRDRAGNEERHRMLLRWRLTLGQNGDGAQQSGSNCRCCNYCPHNQSPALTAPAFHLVRRAVAPAKIVRVTCAGFGVLLTE
jgi:hypothetical protein